MPKGQHGDAAADCDGDGDANGSSQGKRFDYSITLIWWDSEAMTTATKCEEKRMQHSWGKNQRGQALEAVKREIYFEQAL